MTKFEINYSKKTITMLFVLALAVGTINAVCPDGSQESQTILDCIDSIKVDGQFCRALTSGGVRIAELYNNKTDYCCAVNGVYDSNPYFKKMPVSPGLCSLNVASCFGAFPDSYNQISFTTENGEEECKMLFSETCYRGYNNTEEPDFLTNFQTTGPVQLGAIDCCYEECDELYSINMGGCGSDGVFYTNLNQFCDQYCLNKTLFLVPCGSTNGSVNCITHQSCPSLCDTEALDRASCGSNGVLYINKVDLCTAFNDGVIASYDQCENTNGCTQTQCTYNKCIQDLAELNYQGPQICGSSGTFYNTLESFCTAIGNDTEYFFSLCENGPCDSPLACCDRVCNNNNDTFTTFCANDFSFFTIKADYCAAMCGGSVAEEILCGGNHCSQSGCCVAECVDTYPKDVCNKTTGQLWSNESMCESEGCSGNISNLATQCFDTQGIVVSCTQEDCDAMFCEENMILNGGERKICGSNGTYYMTIEDYCNALHRTNNAEYELLCNGTSCLNGDACCQAHCNEVTFVGGFQERCDDSFVEYLTKGAYCAEECDTGLTDLMCGNELCTLVECCQQNCSNIQNFDVCSATFQVISGNTDCQNNCTTNGGIIYDCNGQDCDQGRCDQFQCIHSTLANYPTSVCVRNADGSFAYLEKQIVCPMIVLGGSIPFMCENCVDLNDCANAYCALQITIEDAICDDNFNIYTTGLEYCQANNNALNLILDCNGSNCDHRECCFAKCETEITTSACNMDHHYVMLAQERCHFRCGNQHIDREDLLVNKCYDGFNNETDCQSCETFRCEADFSGYIYNTVCINHNNTHSFYGSVNLYCMFLVGGEVQQFHWDYSIACNGIGCIDDNTCCVAACEVNQADGFLNYCNLDGYSVVDLNLHCQNHCGLLNITNTHSCGNENCDLPDCLVEKCKAETSNAFSSICLTSEFYGNFFYPNVNDYCVIAVSNSETNFDVTAGEMACNGTACTDLDDCCYHRCLTETYINSCSADSHSIIDEAAFCTHRCFNNVNRVDMVLDTCNDLNGQIPCTDCAVFDCEDNIIALAYSFSTVCINNNDISVFFANYLEFCGYLVSNIMVYEIQNDIDCNGAGCVDGDDCCFHVCMSTTYQPGCDDSFAFFNQTNYCTSFCAGNAPTLTYCGTDVCSEEICNFRNCMDVIRPVYREMCLKDSVSLINFFDNKEAYCNTKVLAQESDYTNFDEIFCVDEGRCEDNAECCHFRCTNEEYFAGCHTQMHHLVNEVEFCQYRCDSVSNPSGNDLALITCSDGSGNRIACSEDFCNQQDCVIYLGNVNNYVGSNVCSTTDIFYTNYNDFCAAVNGDLNMVQLCPDTNQNQVGCGSDDQCCLANCLQMQNYTARCNTTDYIFKSTLLSYCEDYCGNDRTFETYLDYDGNFASQAMCCSMRCDGNSSSHQKVCNAGNFDLIDEVGTCQHLCENPNGMGIVTCGSQDCTQRDCNEFKCLNQLENMMYSSTHICGNNNVFYTRANYCDAREDDPSLSLVLCGSIPCGNGVECCQSNCINNYLGSFQEMCDQAFNIYTTVEEYCLAKCTIGPITPLQCQGNNCNLNQCCKQECLSQSYNPMCSPQPECELMDHATYCNNKCDQVDFSPMTCDAPQGCTQNNCDHFECLYSVDLVHENNSVCGNNGTFYNDENEFCLNKSLGNVDHFFLCEGTICGSSYDCCFHVCVDDNEATYNPRCGSDYVLHNTVQNYCTAKCSTSNYSDLMCGDMYCTADECCSLDCQNSPYLGHCDNLFNYLDHASYCDNDCNANGHDIISCDGGCNQQKCDLKKCENSLSTRVFESICVDPAYNSIFFFLTKLEFCEAKLQNNDHLFLVSNEVGCVSVSGGDVACAGSHECCVARCLQNNQYDICSSTYDIISPDVFCANQCNGTPITNFDTCDNGQGQQEDCNSCQQFRCIDLTVNFNSTVCAYDVTPPFFSNSVAFCNSVIAQNLDIQVMINSIVLCDGVNCDFNTCCVANCEIDNASTFFDVCDVNTFSIYNLRAFCIDQCAATNTNTEGCGPSTNCVLSDCRVKQCLVESNPSTNPRLCLNPAQHGRNYFESLLNFCDHVVSNGMMSYDASTSVQCNSGVCGDSFGCCLARCQEEIYLDGCNLNNYDVVGELEYCTYRCNNNAHEILNYVNMNIYTCLAIDLTPIPCDQGMCNMERCRQTFIGYGFTNICLSNDFQLNFFFANVDAYCTHILGQPVVNYSLPNHYTCNNNQNCNNLDECCFARCMAETYFIGCDVNSYTTVSHNLFCSHRCAANNPSRNDLALDSCGPTTNCSSCEFFKCMDVISGVNDNICLYVFSSIGFFYENHTDYCNAKFLAGQTDYALNAGNSLDCGDNVNGCANSNDCCMAKCMNQTFFNVCRTTDFLLFNNQSLYCMDQCSINPSSFDICLDNQNQPIDCNNVSCCEFELDNSNSFDLVCDNLGNMFNNSFDFCTERETNNSSIAEVLCNGGVCNDQTCHNEYCYVNSPQASLTFPRCDNLYSFHFNVQSFCDAQYTNNSLTILNGCIGTGCAAVDCCILQCNDNPDNTSNDAVVVLINGQAFIYDNACVAACNTNEPVFFVCTGISDHAACLTHYQNSCDQHCNMYNNHTETYCGNGSLFYSAYQYCQIYECVANQNPPAWTATVGCENNDCSADQCSFNQCEFGCGSTSTPVCGNNGTIYTNLCLLNCYNSSVLFGSVTFEYTCDSLNPNVDCATQCTFDNCMGGCNGTSLPVCANSQIYPTSCHATCSGMSVSFTCQESCSGNLRESRCAFDCVNGENPEL